MTVVNAKSGTTPATTTKCGGKYLVFVLGKDLYGLPVLRVREIIRYMPPIHIPQLPDHIRGVVNLRGKVIPVVDLRLKFNLPAECHGDGVCIIFVQIHSPETGDTTTGMIVDGVEEVNQIAGDDIEPAPDFGAGLDTQYILGMAKTGGNVKTLINIDRALAAEASETTKTVQALRQNAHTTTA